VQYIGKIFKLHNLLKDRRTPISSAFIDEKLNCTKATRQRIIKDLRALGAPLSNVRNQGYFYDREDPRGAFELPGLWLSAEELQALIACQHLLGNLTPGLLKSEIGQLREHLQKLLDRVHGVNLPQLVHIKILSHACRQRNDTLFLSIAEALFNQQQLTINYHARSDDQTSQRNVSPQNLVLYRDNWYLDAYCHARNQPRTFALDRINRATANGQPAIVIDPTTLHQHFGASYGIFAGQAQHTAILNFSAHAARWVADEHWHSQQQSQWLADGNYQMTIPFNRHEELLMDILKWGAEVEVVKPEFLRTLVRQTAENILAKYR
jgi:proteasome accessory factor C